MSGRGIRIARVAGAVLLAALLGGCGIGRSEVHVDAGDDGGAAELGIGQVLVVELEGNPSTGFEWGAVSVPDFLEQVGTETFEADSEGAVGSGGIVRLDYVANEPGTGTLELEYSRPWEDGEPLQTYTIEVTCRP